MTAVQQLTQYIHVNGPIPTARVSSAQAKGNAKNYAYWGTVRYEVRIGSGGFATNVALERAGSDRRSERLAREDCDELCEREGRIYCSPIGAVTEDTARNLMLEVAE